MDILPKYGQEKGEWLYRRNLLDSILVSSVSKEGIKVPTVKEAFMSEVVNGTIDYIGGNAGKRDYQKINFSLNFEGELFRYFLGEMYKHSEGNLNPKIGNALIALCDPSSGSYWETELYDHFSGDMGEGIFSFAPQSITSLSTDYIERVQNKVIPSFSPSERKDIQGIGKSMRKYMNDDLKIIGKTFFW